jgi:hypothetical protein
VSEHIVSDEAGNCGKSRCRSGEVEETASLTSEAGVRLTIAKGQYLFTVMLVSVSLSLKADATSSAVFY